MGSRKVLGSQRSRGAGFGHTKIQGKSVLVRGLNVLASTLSTPLAAPVITATRLRGGTANWTAWEDAVISLEVNGKPNAYSDRPTAALLALVRICSHYFSNAAWLEEGVLLRNAHKLAGIPGVLIHGRFDLDSPLDNAWRLAQAWPDARLAVVGDSGHTGSDTMRKEVLAALDGFAS
jgi:pimeloyl-ACP methyl ester carboxylesterase